MTTLTLEEARRTRAPYALAVLALGSIALSIWGATQADVTRIDDHGLGSVLPAAFWVGVLGLNVAFIASLARRESPTWLPSTMLAGLVVVLYGLASFADAIPRNAVAWRHIGIADALPQVGIAPKIDVYFNWSGFFAGLETFVRATGIPPLQLALWAPVINAGLWALAVLAMLRVFTRDRTHLFLAVWLFLLGNWIDQDYLSPQAFGMFLHVVVLTLAMSSLGATVHGRAPGFRSFWTTGHRVPEHTGRRGRVLAYVIVLGLSAALVTSHQLTPVVLIASLAALSLLRRSWAPWLPVLVGIFFALWLAFPASTYLVGHPPFGPATDGVLGANLVQRISGSAGRLDIQSIRLGLTFSLWLLAAVGAFLLWRAGHRRRRDRQPVDTGEDRDLRPYVLAVVPFLMLPLQSYGGEMLLRVTLFALPFVAFIAARALLPMLAPEGRGRAGRVLLVALVCSVLAGCSIFARYGNTRFDMFSAAEVQAVEEMYELSAPDTLLVAGTQSTPWGSHDYAQFRRRSVQSLCKQDYSPDACVATLDQLAVHESGRGGMQLVLTRGNQASFAMFGQMSTAQFEEFERGIRRLPGTELIFSNSDARVYHMRPTAGNEG